MTSWLPIKVTRDLAIDHVGFDQVTDIPPVPSEMHVKSYGRIEQATHYATGSHSRPFDRHSSAIQAVRSSVFFTSLLAISLAATWKFGTS